jgi:hypothetical protein
VSTWCPSPTRDAPQNAAMPFWCPAGSRCAYRSTSVTLDQSPSRFNSSRSRWTA